MRHRLRELMQHGLLIIGVVDERLRLDYRRRLIDDLPHADMDVNFLYDNILKLHREVLIVVILQRRMASKVGILRGSRKENQRIGRA